MYVEAGELEIARTTHIHTQKHTHTLAKFNDEVVASTWESVKLRLRHEISANVCGGNGGGGGGEQTMTRANVANPYLVPLSSCDSFVLAFFFVRLLLSVYASLGKCLVIAYVCV